MPKQGNLVLPTSIVLARSPIHRLEQTIVNLDPDEAHHLSGDYNKDDEELMPSKNQLMELAYAAGISFKDSHEVRGHPEGVFEWIVTGQITDALNDVRSDTTTYRLDLRYEEVDGVDGARTTLIHNRNLKNWQYVVSHPNKKKAWEPALEDHEAWTKYTRQKTLDEVSQRRAFGVQLAETGAKLRIIRNLTSMPQKMTRKKMSQPFIVIRTNVDIGLALSMGGEWGQMAQQMLMGAIAQKLGLSLENLPALPATATHEPMDKRLILLTEEEQEELISDLMNAGMKDRAACDAKAQNAFGLSISQLCVLHADLLREQIRLYNAAKESGVNDEDLRAFMGHINNLLPIVFDDRSTLENWIEQSWWDRVFPSADLQDPHKLWAELGDIPVDDDGNIELAFLHFEAGTDREEIWHWFEETFDLSVAEDLMGIAEDNEQEETESKEAEESDGAQEASEDSEEEEGEPVEEKVNV